MDNRVITGEGSFKSLEKIVKNYKKTLVFTFLKTDSPAPKKLRDFLNKLKKQSNLTIIPYNGKSLPYTDLITLYNQIIKISGIDLIVGIGGGTILDTAKIISLAYSNQTIQFDKLLNNRELKKQTDLTFVPTTAGTGSEATSFAVIYRDKIKYSIVNQNFLPRYTILDPQLLESLPKQILHTTILDALAQAIESIWAVNSNQESKRYAQMTIDNIANNTEDEYSTAHFEKLLHASYYSGKAINISKTTLSHSISYPLSSFFGIPHGTAVFLTLPSVSEFNFYCTKENIQKQYKIDDLKESFDILFDLFKSKNIVEFKDCLYSIMEKFGIKQSLRDYGIKPKDLKLISEYSISRGRADNNPRKAGTDTVLKLLEKIY